MTATGIGRLLRLQRRLHSFESDRKAQLAQQAQVWQEKLTAAQTHRDTERAALTTELTGQVDQWRQRLDLEKTEMARLADEFLPEALKQLRQGQAIDDILTSVAHDDKKRDEFGTEHRALLRSALNAVEEEFNRSTTAEQAVVSIGSRMQVYTSKIRGRLQDMQLEHGRSPAVAQGLMELDQEIGPADCLAASIVVLGGADRPARQFQESRSLLSVVRGGLARIKEYKRVDIGQLPELGLEGALVDHLTLILAHLLDNATRYSPPTEPVAISAKEVPNGVGIKIQDAGKGLNEEKKYEAQQSLDGVALGPGLGGLAEDAHLGLRVVGILARKYGIKVTFDDSPWLGTSVVVVVPHEYFSPMPAATVPDGLFERSTLPPQSAEPPTAADTIDDLATTEGGLPKRNRRHRAAPSAPQDSTGKATAPTVPSEASFAGMAAFADGSRQAAGSDTDERTDGSESE